MPYRPLSQNERILVKRQFSSTSTERDCSATELKINALEHFAQFNNMPTYEFFLNERDKLRNSTPDTPSICSSGAE